MVSSERAEQSAARVSRALAHYRQQLDGDPLRRAARSSRRSLSREGATRTFQAQDAVLRIVAITEAFSLGRFVDVVEPRLPSDPVVAALWDAELDRASDTWAQRDDLWKNYKNVQMATFPQRQILLGFIEARNAISHGLGELTRKQLRKRSTTIARLRHARIRLRGDSLVIGTADVELCACVAKEFIRWLDDTSR
jgi:hypothetical protein